MDVWVLWHIPPDADSQGDHMLIGVYSTRGAALATVQRLADRPGFADHRVILEDPDCADTLGPWNVR